MEMLKNLRLHFKARKLAFKLRANRKCMSSTELAEALGGFRGRTVTEALSPVIEDPETEPHVRMAAGVSLAKIGDARALDYLTEFLATKPYKEITRIEVVIDVLGESGDPRAAEALVAATKDSEIEPQVRAAAAIALSRAGDARAIHSLIALIKKKRYHHFENIISTLGDLGDAREISPNVVDEFMIRRRFF